MAEDASSKKFIVSNFMVYKMIDSRPVMEQFHEMLRILGHFAQHNLKMDEAIVVAVIIDKLPPSWKDFKHNLKHNKEELTLTQLGSHLWIEESLRTQELDNNPKGKNQVGSSSVNMVEGESSKNPKKSNGKGKFKGKDDKSSNKKAKLVCWNCNKPGHFTKDFRLRKVNKDGVGPSGSKDPEKQQGQISVSLQNSKYIQNYISVISEAFYVQDDKVPWWVDPGATSHVCKDLYWFKDFQPIEDGSIVKMGNVATEPIKGIGSVLLTYTSGKCLCLNNVLYVPGIRKNLVCEIVLNNSGYKQVLESDKESKVLDLIHSALCDFHAAPSLGNKKYVVTFIDDASRYCYIYLLHSKDEALDKFKIYKQQVELHKNELIKVLRTNRGGEYYDPVYFESTGIIHQTTAPYTPQQNDVAERKNRTLKEMVNSMLSYSSLSEGFWGEAMLTACYILNRTPNKRSKNTPYELWCKRVPNLSYLKFGVVEQLYAEHSKAYRFYVLESNDSVSINTVIESRDAIFDEEIFTSIPRPRDTIHQSSNKSITQAEDVSGGATSVPEPRKSTRARKAKSFGSDFQLYLVEGTRNETISQHQYCFDIEEDPKTFSEAMASRDVHFWKEAIHDEIDSIMHNNTWALGCKWILKRKMKVDGTIAKYKVGLVIQGFRQKECIDFFDTYAPVARISTIRLLLALAAIHNLVIHQMDVKTAFLNGDLDEEIYMKQPEGFVMPGNEHKVCKLKKSLYGLKQAPKQWHQKFDDVVLSNCFALNQADKYVYSKFDTSGKGVMICLYVDDMLIFGTGLEEVNKTKKFLSSSFEMKDLGEAEVILGIRIKQGNNGISISQSHYIEKILKKFNFENCSPVRTPIDPSLKLLPNKGSLVSQLEYSRAIGCLIGYPSVLEGYSDASWINYLEDHSSISGWVFLLGGGAISWASKKQTCITNSTMESEFVALSASGKEVEWLRNLIYEIPLWPKPISTISIRCDSAATLAKAYSQVYNGKSRHLGVRHSMIRELIMTGVISVEFVRTQLNLADYLTKGLARDLVHKAAIRTA
uniref:Integrase catalytic domain-containing protein n=1 Tax=Lactuca sativa TaxID=4236 RepID=A0A9R1V5W3_LACSA|nr:hypothetical protein LSAT_V11C600326060 [Lactuca sativa]